MYVTRCAHCFVQDAPHAPFLVCASCKRAHYCSRDCQVSHWSAHKAACRLNAGARESMRSDQRSKARLAVSSRWISSNRSMLSMIATVALNKRDPGQHVVYMKAEQNGTSLRVNEVHAGEDAGIGESGELTTLLRTSRRSVIGSAAGEAAAARYVRVLLDVTCPASQASRIARALTLEMVDASVVAAVVATSGGCVVDVIKRLTRDLNASR